MTVEIPDLTDRVIGYRSWHCESRQDHYLLRGWEPGLNTAKCTHDDHNDKVPVDYCECGLYAFHEPIKASLVGYGEVSGAIVAWGRVSVSSNGFRAQYAQIVALTRVGLKAEHLAKQSVVTGEMSAPGRGVEMSTPGRYDWLQTIGKAYEVPVVPWNELEAVAARYADPIPKSMRPGGRRPLKKKRASAPITAPPGSVRPQSMVPAFILGGATLFALIEIAKEITT